MFWYEYILITVLLTPETPKTYRWLTNLTKLTDQTYRSAVGLRGGGWEYLVYFPCIFPVTFDLVDSNYLFWLLPFLDIDSYFITSVAANISLFYPYIFTVFLALVESHFLFWQLPFLDICQPRPIFPILFYSFSTPYLVYSVIYYSLCKWHILLDLFYSFRPVILYTRFVNKTYYLISCL